MALASASGAERRPAVDLQVWQDLAAPIDDAQLQFRPDGQPKERTEGNQRVWYCRYVAYIDAHLVRAHLDTVAPGQWSSQLTPLPFLGTVDGGVVEHAARCSFLARLTICGVTREDVGSGKDYKSAASDAFKRVAVRFGVGASLHDLPQVWVPVEVKKDGDRYRVVKPLQSPHARLAELRAKQEREARNANRTRQTRRSA